MKTDKEITEFVEEMSSAQPTDQKIFLDALEKYFSIISGEPLEELKGELIEYKNSYEEVLKSDNNCREIIRQQGSLVNVWYEKEMIPFRSIDTYFAIQEIHGVELEIKL